mmetsp:Transcript_13910/g.30764  ORF Transcript_13910/g.30764 Transcript_13910/m.30764 type:complete len:233 (-) Transcript_13910:41-739(-)
MAAPASDESTTCSKGEDRSPFWRSTKKPGKTKAHVDASSIMNMLERDKDVLPVEAPDTPIEQRMSSVMGRVSDDRNLEGTEYKRTALFRPEHANNSLQLFRGVCEVGDLRVPAAPPGSHSGWDFQAGDFTLAERGIWRKVFGYPELPFAFGVDSAMLCKLSHAQLRWVVLLDPCYMVHQHHSREGGSGRKPLLNVTEMCSRVRSNKQLHASATPGSEWGMPNVQFEDVLVSV